MKYIDIFLSAPTTDMFDERMELGNYFRGLNDVFVGRGLYFRLHMNEDMSDILEEITEFSGDEPDSDYFFVMFHGKNDGVNVEELENVVREFDDAFEKFKSGGSPKIMTFFKGITDDESMNDAVRRFVSHLGDEIQHYYTKFENLDSVKLKMLLELTNDPANHINVEFKDAKIYVDGNEFGLIDLENLPLYANHEAIGELRVKLVQLENEFIAARLNYMADPENDDLFSEVLTKSEQKNKVADQIHQYEMDLLKATSNIVAMSTSGEKLTARAMKAIELLEMGKFREAREILDDEERKKSAEMILERLDSDRFELEALVKEALLKIDMIKTGLVTGDMLNAISNIYEEVWMYTQKGNLSRIPLKNYIMFLFGRKKFEEGIEKGEILLEYFRYKNKDEQGKFDADIVELCGILDSFYVATNKSHRYLKERYETCRKLYQKEPDVYALRFASICMNLGSNSQRSKKYEDSKKYCQESLEILFAHYEDNPSKYVLTISRVYRILATLEENLKEYEFAEAHYKKIIELYDGLSEDNFNDWENWDRVDFLADICENLSVLYVKLNRFEEAEMYKKMSEMYFHKSEDFWRKVYSSQPQNFEDEGVTVFREYKF